MAAPLPPDMENDTQKRSRRRSALSYGFFGFALGTAFGVGVGSWISNNINSVTVFMIAVVLIALYLFFSRWRRG